MASWKQTVVQGDYGKEMSKTRRFDKIRTFFDMSDKKDYTIDDQTWNDLDMNKVYEKLDRTYSSPGEAALYTMLRNPLSNEEELKARGSLIEEFKNDSNLRNKLSLIFYDMYIDRKNNFLDMMGYNLSVNKPKFFIYTFFGQLVPLGLLLATIFVNIQFIVALLLSLFLNIIINRNEQNKVKSNGILYLRKVIKGAKKISQVNNPSISYYTDILKANLKSIKAIDSSLKYIGFVNMWGGFFEMLTGLVLIEECAYYSVSDKINKRKDDLMELFYTVGEIEALISISSYQENIEYSGTTPKFTKDVTLKITEGIHPILKKPVANSITIDNKGIVLTGTNMSGKSTFLRMLGVNIVLAQTFYFVLAKNYEAPFFNIVSSISPNDDITEGKSYFMAEVDSLLRIIKATDKELPVFCAIDEIFRGTNPTERIAMSAEILTYINKKKTISIVSTHDRELTNILKDNFDFYYFSENVDTKKGLSFDYKLKKGVSQTKNAIKLLEYRHYPKEITAKAFERAERIEGYN